MVLEEFQFKQFSFAHDRCAKKVGTDAVLLDAWAPVNPKIKSILYVGAGCGILVLMLAQRSKAKLIDGLEIDVEAYEQCVTNFEESSRANRLFCYHNSLKEYTNEMNVKYDFIISNPPFYNSTYITNNKSVYRARFESAMSFNEILQSVRKLLSEKREFCVIVPFESEDKLVEMGKEKQCYKTEFNGVFI